MVLAFFRRLRGHVGHGVASMLVQVFSPFDTDVWLPEVLGYTAILGEYLACSCFSSDGIPRPSTSRLTIRFISIQFKLSCISRKRWPFILNGARLWDVDRLSQDLSTVVVTQTRCKLRSKFILPKSTESTCINFS